MLFSAVYVVASVVLLQAEVISPQACEYLAPTHVNCSSRDLLKLPSSLGSSVRVLDFKFNELSILRKNFFVNSDLINLRSVILANNKISFIDSSAFEGMNDLQSVDLSANKLTYLYPNTFLHAVRLSWLNLAENENLILPSYGHFLNSPYLKTLYLGSNNIKTFSLDTFQCTPNIQRLYLNNNAIRNLDVAIFTNMNINEACYHSNTVLKQLKTLDLSGNQFPCDCKFYGLVLWYSELELGETPKCYRNGVALDGLYDLDCTRATFPWESTKPQTEQSANGLQSITDHWKYLKALDTEQCVHYQSVFVLGIVIGVLSASCVFLLAATIAYLVRKCWSCVVQGRMGRRRQSYEEIE